MNLVQLFKKSEVEYDTYCKNCKMCKYVQEETKIRVVSTRAEFSDETGSIKECYDLHHRKKKSTRRNGEMKVKVKDDNKSYEEGYDDGYMGYPANNEYVQGTQNYRDYASGYENGQKDRLIFYEQYCGKCKKM